MSDYRTKNRVLAVKAEATPGVEDPPNPTTDAIRVTEPGYSPQLQNNPTGYSSRSLGTSENVPGGGFMNMAAGFYFKGAGTAGIAPEWGRLMLAMGCAETLLVADEAESSVAGGPDEITLAVSASSTPDFYVGMMIVQGGEKVVITAYDFSTQIAKVLPNWVVPPTTTAYVIPACAKYAPVSDDLTLVTAWQYQNSALSGVDSWLRKAVGCAGTGNLSVSPRGLARCDVTLSGMILELPDTVSLPGKPVFQPSLPESILSADVYLNQTRLRFRDFNMDFGNTVQLPDDPQAFMGYDRAGIVERAPVGTVNANTVLKSVRDALADWRNSVNSKVWTRWGSGAGFEMSILYPQFRYTGQDDSDIDGYNAEALPFELNQIDSEYVIVAA